MAIIDSRTAYKAPLARLVEVNVHSVLCESPATKPGAVTIDRYKEEKLDW